MDVVFPINAGGIVIELEKLEWVISYRVVDVGTSVTSNALVASPNRQLSKIP